MYHNHNTKNTMRSFQWLTSSLLAAAALLLWNDGHVVHAFSTMMMVIHSIDNIPFRETEIYISTLNQPITILEATAEGQNKLVDEILMLDEERGDGGDDNNVVIDNDDPYGSVLWPAAQTYSHYYYTNHHVSV